MHMELSLDDLEDIENWTEAERHIFETTLKPGDQVRIARKVVQQEGWYNSWAGRMEKLIGTVQTVKVINRAGVYFDRTISDCGFPPGSLDPA